MESITMTATDAKLEHDIEVLKQIMWKRGGFKRGKFTLASGQKSDVYFNSKKLTQDPEGISIIAKIIFEKISDLDIQSVGGLAQGCIPIASAVAQLSYQKGKPISAFWVRRNQKDHGDRVLVEGILEEGSKVVIVDDVATRGNSIDQAVKEVNNRKCTIAKIIVLLDREEGAKERFRSKGIPYEFLLKKSDFT